MGLTMGNDYPILECWNVVASNPNPYAAPETLKQLLIKSKLILATNTFLENHTQTMNMLS